MSYICGIIDIGAKTVSFERLYAMSRSMARRGGVQMGAYINRGTALSCGGSIFTPREPYTLVRGGRAYTAVLDGEIYNTRELAKLMGRGDFSCAAEAVTETYISFGYDCASMLDGVFSLAIYDECAGEVYLARDPIGAKPLYYHKDGARVSFSSEIKGILRYMRNGIEVGRSALGELLRSADTNVGGTELYRDVEELGAGSFAVCSALGVTVREYRGDVDRTLSRWRSERAASLEEPNEKCDPRTLMGELLTAFDYPCFDEHMTSYLATLTRLCRSGERNAVIEDPALPTNLSYALERADRLGTMRGIVLGVTEPSGERDIKRRVFVAEEKRLAREAEALLSERSACLPKFFGGEILERVRAERDAKTRVRRLGIIIQSELWLRRYPLILV